MDGEHIKAFATAQAIHDEAIENHKAAVTSPAEEERTPGERFDDIWDRVKALGDIGDDERNKGGFVVVYGMTETGVPVSVAFTLKDKRAPRGSLGFDSRTIEAQPAANGQNLGEEPESVNDIWPALHPEPEVLQMLRNLTLVEQSVAAAEQMRADFPDMQPSVVSFAQA